ncbi:MAG: (2Fe-2S)-binding protein [Clostridiales bacterium]|jgi:succinate dehydrogenase/fumarate reductase-like Fe-S protein|nr:(2Fe-2S)-binding protein [Clostridiales bacterium]
MQKMANVYFDGKHYLVPDDLTIMTAMEYAGIRLIRGCGCRHGFCGACAAIYRIKGENRPHFSLSCQTKVEDEMYVATLPFFPLNKKDYDLNELTPSDNIMMELFPEIYACVGCNACTKSCTRALNVMQYIAMAKRGGFEACAHISFDCTACGICSARCPANISHNLVGLLARRLTGKYIQPEAAHNTAAAAAIAEGRFDAQMDEIMALPMEKLKEMYDNREIEK